MCKSDNILPFHSLIDVPTITHSCSLILALAIFRYIDTGKVENNEAHLNRSAPLTFAEALTVMTKLSWQVPGWFLLATIPRT